METSRRTYTIALTSFSRVDGARQYDLYILLCQARSIEFSNLKHLPGLYVNETMPGVNLAGLTGPGRQTFLQCRCTPSAFSRPCSCCLQKARVSNKLNGPQ